MSDERALLAAIAVHPQEDTPRLAYADWLDENGRPERAEFIRLQIELAAMKGEETQYAQKWRRSKKLESTLRESPGLYYGQDAQPAASEAITPSFYHRGFPVIKPSQYDYIEGVNTHAFFETLSQNEAFNTAMVEEVPIRNTDDINQLNNASWKHRVKGVVILVTEQPNHPPVEEIIKLLENNPSINQIKFRFDPPPSQVVGVMDNVSAMLQAISGSPVNKQISALTFKRQGCSVLRMPLGEPTYGSQRNAIELAGDRLVTALSNSSFKSVERLEFNGVNFPNASITRLVNANICKNVKRLGLRFSGLDDQTMIDVGQSPVLKNLREIDAGLSDLQGSGSRWIKLSNIKQLVDLDVSSTNLSKAFLTLLSDDPKNTMPNLVSLEYQTMIRGKDVNYKSAVDDLLAKRDPDRVRKK